ncbi:MAG: lipoyl synthase [Gammaproteobacteria bacterium]|nr:lipoyl synthase [Gammaproteobacteria bacterium]
MTSFKGIPIESGAKYTTDAGFTAIRNGIKQRGEPAAPDVGRKPDWLRIRLASGGRYGEVQRTVHEHRLATVCEESMCPNIGECWNAGTATIMLMGHVCTRACRFCAVDTGNPRGWLDPDEPANAARSVELMGLRYVVLTSVDRDDLADGGAGHYAACVRAIKERNPATAVEALTPDFAGDLPAVAAVVASGVDVFAHNLETVRRLTPDVRDPRAGYDQSLRVLAHAATAARESGRSVLTKSSLMLGLGETPEEVATAMDDLRAAGVGLLTLGQYLRPTANHLPVREFIHPDRFDDYRRLGLARGFVEVVAGPLVRSSYRAERALEGNNAGLAGYRPA